MRDKPEVTIYVDGAAVPNPGDIAVGIVMLSGKLYKEFGRYVGTGTNQAAEIHAARIALEALKLPCRVTIYSDSQYLIKTMNGEYARRANVELWEGLDAALGEHEITWTWVKGHNGDKHNERANRLAENAARAGS